MELSQEYISKMAFLKKHIENMNVEEFALMCYTRTKSTDVCPFCSEYEKNNKIKIVNKKRLKEITRRIEWL